jgi:Protein of unknown function (DUF3224)
MAAHATGTFDVKVTPQTPGNQEAQTANIGRLSLDKQFHGDLDASSKGEMLAVRNESLTSGGYVAIERITGTLHGRTGSFALQHSGTMIPGHQQSTIIVVPDSGSDKLTGLTGKMVIKIENKQHLYEFDYALPD